MEPPRKKYKIYYHPTLFDILPEEIWHIINMYYIRGLHKTRMKTVFDDIHNIYFEPMCHCIMSPPYNYDKQWTRIPIAYHQLCHHDFMFTLDINKHVKWTMIVFSKNRKSYADEYVMHY